MSREKQIEERIELSDIIDYALRDWDDYIYECQEEGNRPIDTFEEWIADAVLKNGYRKQSEWISVEERLPDCEWGAESKAVLFITKQGFMYTGYYGCGGIYRDRYFREYKNSTDGYDISSVTHWMPLPEPPKGGVGS